MLFEDKFNNSMYTIIRVNSDFENLIVDFIMSLPSEILDKIKEGREFNLARDPQDIVRYAFNDDAAVLETYIDDRYVSILVYSFMREDLENIEICSDDIDIGPLIENSKKLAHIQIIEKDDEYLDSYFASLARFEDGYEIILVRAKSLAEEEIEAIDYDIEEYTTRDISSKELLEIMDMKDKKAIR